MTRLSQISIENYKAFYHCQKVPIAQPNGNIGSGLTIIVGQNNSGKSTVLDALLLLQPNKKLPQEDRHGSQPVEIVLTSDINSDVRITNVTGGSQLDVQGSVFTPSSFEFVPSRRHWSHQFNNEGTLEQYQQNSFQIGRNGTINDSLGPLLARINISPEQKNVFNQLVQRVLPTFNTWTVETDQQGDYIKYSTRGGANHRTDRFGDGVISLFRIIAYMVSHGDNRILVIDEPELSLHPQAQRALARLIAEQSKNKQIIVATHSPHFIRWSDLEAGAQVVRIRKQDDKISEVFHITSTALYKQKLFSMDDDWQKPHLLDIIAKEIFFAENLAFVEGQEDVGLLRKFIDDEKIIINFEFFGYGCGAAESIPLFLQMAKDLGLRSAALFDGDKKSDAKVCEEKFSEAKIQTLPTDDIRDKHEQEIKNGRWRDTPKILKAGIFDKSGKIKQEYKQQLRSIVENFISHFKSSNSGSE